MSTALITGATSGIGLEFAHILAENGHNVVLVSRSKSKLQDAQKQLTNKYSVAVYIYAQDLSKPDSARKTYEATKKHNIDILINNAGAGFKGDFFADTLADNQRIAHLNMQSLVELTHYFGKDFIANKSGRILNIASIAAFFPGPKQPVYYASKAFVRSFSRALSQLTAGSGVSVTVLNPGVTKTNFFNAAAAKGSGLHGAAARDVALLGYRAMMAGKTEVTFGARNQFITSVLARVVPYSLQAKIIDRASDV